MNGFARKHWAMAALILPTLGGCLGPPAGGGAANVQEQALVEAEGTTCMEVAFRQYLECRELDCARREGTIVPTDWLPGIVVIGYEEVCVRDCEAEAALIRAECEGDAAFGEPFPTQITIQQWHEPDERILPQGGAIDAPCVHCLQPAQ